MMELPHEPGASFEETYPLYPFAELVRLGVGLAAFIARHQRTRRGERSWQKAGTATSSRAGSP